MAKLKPTLKSLLDDSLFAVLIICAVVAAAAMEVTALSGAVADFAAPRKTTEADASSRSAAMPMAAASRSTVLLIGAGARDPR